MSQIDTAAVASTDENNSANENTSVEEQSSVVRALAGELPGRLGDALATLVVVLTLALGVWSLIITWSGNSAYGPSLFNAVVVGTLVGGVALYAHKTFSYVIAIVGAIAWLIVSALPLVPIAQLILQTATITLMGYGVVVAICAVGYNKRRYSYSD
ncbi:MAG: hypothetical protein EPN48_06180 [Microbacteriaceae bacterium]|nr:MAG: hypothetical protein EPN48_06180 [Microbacteriaceae bacterium]